MLPTRALLVLLLTACGPGSGESTSDTSSDTNPDTSTGASTDTATTAPTGATGEPITTSGTTTASADASTGEPTTGAVDPTTSSGTTTSETSTDDTSTGDGDTTTGGADVAYAAFFWAGGLDHVMIHKADFTHDRCTTLHLAWPGQMVPELAITVPDEFAAQNAAIAVGTDGCLEGMPMGEAEAASAGAGAVDWQKDAMMYCPLQLDVDLVLEFPQDLPWVPAQEQLQAVAIPVQNCP